MCSNTDHNHKQAAGTEPTTPSVVDMALLRSDSVPAAKKTHSHSSGHTHSHTHTKAVLNRLSRAIGHLTAVRSMVEDGRDCAEVLIQLAAVRSAINGTCEVILKDHLEHCIVEAVETGDTKTLDELNKAVELLLK